MAVAQRNVVAYGLEHRIRLSEGDLFAPVTGRRYDLILSNPPYVDDAAMATLPPEFSHEPPLALAGGGDGLAVVRAILAAAGRHLKPDGALVVEIGRGRTRLEAELPDLPFVWLDTAASEGEVFWLPAVSLSRPAGRSKARASSIPR